MARSSTTQGRGTSLAKGPIALVGLAGVVYGVLALIFGGNSFTLRIPHGRVGDGHFVGLYTNGWTDLLFVAAGIFLLFAARWHWSSRSAALLVALVLGAAAVIAVIRGNGVFGIFAANHRTEVVWGAAAIVLAVLSRLGRIGGGSRAAPAVGGPSSASGSGTGIGGAGTGGDGSLVSSRD